MLQAGAGEYGGNDVGNGYGGGYGYGTSSNYSGAYSSGLGNRGPYGTGGGSTGAEYRSGAGSVWSWHGTFLSLNN